MKKILPLLIFFGIIIIFFRQALLHGLLPIPADTIVGLYNPYRDAYQKQYPRGIPFKNFLITDPIRQQYPWKSLAISVEKQMQLPLWNPYTFAGSPLLANFQTGAFYPFNILFFIFPFSLGWTIFIMLQPLLAGVFLFCYLRRMRITPIASLLGSIVFAFSGFCVSWLEWGNIVHTILWLPLILLIKEILLEKFTIKYAIILVLVECTAFFAGHLQTYFYTICLSNVYLFARIGYLAYKKTGNWIYQFIRIYLPFLLLGIAMYTITIIQAIPTIQFIFHSARNIDQADWTKAGWFIPWQNAIQFIAPDFFGNPTTLNYWGVWNYAEFVGYIGIIPLIFSIFAMFFRHDKKTLFFTSVCIISLLFAFPTPIAQLPFILHIPFISTAQPTRLLFITDFALAILAALGLDYFMQYKKKMFIILGMMIIIFIAIWAYLILLSHFGKMLSSEEINIAKRNFVFPTIVTFISIITILFYMFFGSSKNKITAGLVMSIFVIITVIDLLRFSDKFTPFTLSNYLYPQTKTTQFLQTHQGEYRYMTTNAQLLPPNFSIMYKLQTVDGYDPLYIQSYGEFIAAMERNKPNIAGPFGFNRIITPHNYESPFINLLGIKYILSLQDLSYPTLKKVLQEGETRIYENTSVFPRAFFVQQVYSVKNKQEAIEHLFAHKNNLNSVAIVDSAINKKEFSIGTVHIDKYAENSIRLQTNSNAEGFLVLTDIYYPTWHVFIDGKETTIYLTDYIFRGIIVPAGKHTIIFQDYLF